MKIPHTRVSFDHILSLTDSLFFVDIVEDMLLVYGQESDSVLIVLNPPYLGVSDWLRTHYHLAYNPYRIRSEFPAIKKLMDFRLLVCDISLPRLLETHTVYTGGLLTTNKDIDKALYLIYSMPSYLVTHDVNYDISCGFIQYTVNDLLTSICLSLGIPETFYNKLRNLIRWIK